jgi:hypothetical protein
MLPATDDYDTNDIMMYAAGVTVRDNLLDYCSTFFVPPSLSLFLPTQCLARQNEEGRGGGERRRKAGKEIECDYRLL